MTEATKEKIRNTLKAKGIRPLHPMDWTGLKHSRPSPRIGEKRPSYIGKKISKANKGRVISKITREKISESLVGRYRGELSPVWIKDRSKIKKQDNRRDDSDYKIWRQSVYKRDNWKCKINDENCKGRIEAHHILAWKKYPELRYRVNNGITLCHFHHPRSVKKQELVSPYLLELLAKGLTNF